MSLRGIAEHRKAVARIVRRERRRFDQVRGVDVDVSTLDDDGSGVAAIEHRRNALEARAAIHRMHDHDIDVDADLFEEWSHTK